MPLSEEKATTVPAGMALPRRSTTVTMNDTGAPGDPNEGGEVCAPVEQAGNITVLPSLMVMTAWEPENMIGICLRTWMCFCALHAVAELPAGAFGLQSTPFYLLSGPL